jgi:putative NADH-flavin reductase
MKLTIFGATGQTGKPLVEQALSAGYDVIAFVRNPSRLTIIHEHLRVVQGDATDPVAVELAVRGTDAVISVLATSASQKTAKAQPLRRATQNIVDAMKKHGVQRLIISSSGLPQASDEPDLRFSLLMGFVKRIVRASYEDTLASTQVVQASDLDWTIVRMPAPTNAPKTGRVQAGYVNKVIGLRISRADAAAIMLNELREAKYVHHTPVVSNF